MNDKIQVLIVLDAHADMSRPKKVADNTFGISRGWFRCAFPDENWSDQQTEYHGGWLGPAKNDEDAHQYVLGTKIYAGGCALDRLHEQVFQDRAEEAYSNATLWICCTNDGFVENLKASDSGERGRVLGKFEKVRPVCVSPEELEQLREAPLDREALRGLMR